MESEYDPNPSKRRYDITMSKRTRKPMLNVEDSYHNPARTEKDVLDEVEDSFQIRVVEGKENDHKSLKQLIHRDEKSKLTIGEESKGRNSLGEHFTAEKKQLQLVKLQQQTSVQGVKLKRMVNRYVKVLSHLIKAKRDPRIGSGKKPVLQLTV